LQSQQQAAENRPAAPVKHHKAPHHAKAAKADAASQ